jgi:aromatic-L-amino-acid decarboxylase
MWILIREEGVCGLQSRLRRDISNAKSLQEKVAAMPGWKVLAPVQLQTVCVRYEPQEVNPEALDQYTRAWVDDLNRSGEGFLTPATIDGRWMVRISIGALETGANHVDAIWDAMQTCASGI